VVEPIDDFERELREQLTARAAPEGFADRVMARMQERGAAPERRWWFRQPVWRWVAATALTAAVAAGGGTLYERQRQEQGEQARAQVLLALRITGTTLRDVERKINNPVGRQGHTGNRGRDQKED
jgi:anti-sigma-K factor RskA